MKKSKILIIDDDLDLLASLKAILETKEFIVSTASAKAEGIKLLNSDKPDLLMLDIMMETDLQGYNMLGELRSQEELNDMPIIIYSGMAEVLGVNYRSAVKDIELYPHVSFVDKADDIEELIFRINYLLEN